MAEEFVGTTQFGEFVKRIDDRFSHVEKVFGHANQMAEQRHNEVNQRLADAEKAREQNLGHIVQRFEQVGERFEQVGERFEQVAQRFDDLKGDIRDIRADMRQMRTWLISLFGLVVFGFIGSIVLMMLRNVFQ